MIYLIDIPSFKYQPADFLYVLCNFFTLHTKKVEEIIKLFFLIINFLIYQFAFEIKAWVTKDTYQRMFIYEIFMQNCLFQKTSRRFKQNAEAFKAKRRNIFLKRRGLFSTK